MATIDGMAMNSNYEKLFTPVTLTSGATIANRFVMAPMVVAGSTSDGDVTDEDVTYFERRAGVAGMLISGAASVGEFSNAFGFGLGAYADRQVDGLGRLATAMKSKGAKAVLQIFHSGRQAQVSFQQHGVAYAPSAIDFDFLDYPVTELTTEQVWQIVEQFGQATRRAVEAGFDGVEIHGANHYLIQQFFSKFSNKRTDEFGAPEKFALEVVKRVKSEAPDGFIVGYRISPDEIHGDVIGYSVADSLGLIDQIANLGVDYIHTSQWGQDAYKRDGVNARFKERLAGRSKLIVAGDIMSADQALEALNDADFAALASVAITEPDFPAKVAEGAPINMTLNDDLTLPEKFSLLHVALNERVQRP